MGKRDMTISSQMRYAFFAACIAGIITHATLMILQPVVADPVLFLFWWKDVNWQLLNQGRWAGNIYKSFFGFLVIPVFSILTKILSVSVSSALFVDILDIKSKLTASLIGIAVVVHPNIANALMYYSTANDFALPLTIFIFWFSTKNQTRTIFQICICSIFIALALGMGQAYLSLITSIFFIIVINNILVKKKNRYQIMFIQIIGIAIGCLIYFTIWKLLSKYNNISIYYGGTDNYNITNTFKLLLLSFKKIYKSFFDYFFNDKLLHNLYWHRNFFNFILILVSAFYFLINFFRDIKNFSKLDITICIMCFILFPISLESICIIVTNYNFYLMMACGYIFIIPFLLSLFEKFQISKTNEWMRKISLTISVIIVWTFMLSDNAGYMYLNQTFLQTKSIAERVLVRIEQIPEYVNDKYIPVCFIGQPERNMNYITNLWNACPGSTFGQQGVFDGLWENSDGWGRYIEYYCGVHLNYFSNGTEDKIKRIISDEKFIYGKAFPATDCVYFDGENIIVKLGDVK